MHTLWDREGGEVSVSEIFPVGFVPPDPKESNETPPLHRDHTFGRYQRGDWGQSPFEQGELTPLAEGSPGAHQRKPVPWVYPPCGMWAADKCAHGVMLKHREYKSEIMNI